MFDKKYTQFSKITILAIICLAALSRLLPHPPNFTPIGAIALFGAAHISRTVFAFLIPFLALWVSNLFLNNVIYAQMYPEFYSGFVWFGAGSEWIYLSFAAIVLLGMFMLKKVSVQRLLAGSLLASVIFFLISNFGTWLTAGMYPPSMEGLIACFTAAIPFFWNTLAGDLFFTGVLFGSFYLIHNRSHIFTGEHA